MMSAFLDALGIAHENGMIEEDAVAPDPAKMAAATAAIAAAYPADDVSLYLDTLRWQDPAAWGALVGARATISMADRASPGSLVFADTTSVSTPRAAKAFAFAAISAGSVPSA